MFSSRCSFSSECPGDRAGTGYSSVACARTRVAGDKGAADRRAQRRILHACALGAPRALASRFSIDETATFLLARAGRSIATQRINRREARSA